MEIFHLEPKEMIEKLSVLLPECRDHDSSKIAESDLSNDLSQHSNSCFWMKTCFVLLFRSELNFFVLCKSMLLKILFL